LSQQTEIIEAVRDHSKVAVRSAHDVGKTAISARVALWFLSAFDPAIVLTTAPTFRQIKELLWREIKQAHAEAVVRLGGTLLDTRFELAVDSYALGLSTSDPVRFQGFHAPNILLIVDEAPGVDEMIFVAADTSLTSEGAKELMIGNPLEVSGRFYDAFHSKRHLYHTIAISAFDSPNFTTFGITLEDIRLGSWEQKITGPLPRPYLITPRWVSEKWDEWGEESPLWQVRVLGDFPEQAADQLIPLSWIEQAVTREMAVAQDAPHILGVDVARFGEDETVVCVRQDSLVKSLFTYHGQDTMVTTGRVIELLNAHDGRGIYVDETGIGAGVTDRLHELRLPVRGIKTGRRANYAKRFVNRRSELWWGLRDRFRLKQIKIPRDDRLIAELVSIKYTIDSSGHIKVESKDDMKKRGLKSPDRADALVLCFAGGVIQPSTVRTRAEARRWLKQTRGRRYGE